jgi:hypothetical protein
MVCVFEFTDGDQAEPGVGIGMCNSKGHYNAPTLPGACGGPVVAVSDGALVGFHIGGGEEMNCFIPMDEEISRVLLSNDSSSLPLFQ